MSNMAWSEQELANAAKRVAESMLTSFPSPSECEHVFSDDFEHSMEILRKKSKRRVVAHKIWQRAAVILIVTILSVSTCAYSQYIALCNSIAMWNPFQAGVQLATICCVYFVAWQSCNTALWKKRCRSPSNG